MAELHDIVVEVRMTELHDAFSYLRRAIRRWKYYTRYINQTAYGVSQLTRARHSRARLAADVKLARNCVQSARDALSQAL